MRNVKFTKESMEEVTKIVCWLFETNEVLLDNPNKVCEVKVILALVHFTDYETADLALIVPEETYEWSGEYCLQLLYTDIADKDIDESVFMDDDMIAEPTETIEGDTLTEAVDYFNEEYGMKWLLVEIPDLKLMGNTADIALENVLKEIRKTISKMDESDTDERKEEIVVDKKNAAFIKYKNDREDGIVNTDNIAQLWVDGPYLVAKFKSRDKETVIGDYGTYDKACDKLEQLSKAMNVIG